MVPCAASAHEKPAARSLPRAAVIGVPQRCVDAARPRRGPRGRSSAERRRPPREAPGCRSRRPASRAPSPRARAGRSPPSEWGSGAGNELPETLELGVREVAGEPHASLDAELAGELAQPLGVGLLPRQARGHVAGSWGRARTSSSWFLCGRTAATHSTTRRRPDRAEIEAAPPARLGARDRADAVRDHVKRAGSRPSVAQISSRAAAEPVIRASASRAARLHVPHPPGGRPPEGRHVHEGHVVERDHRPEARREHGPGAREAVKQLRPAPPCVRPARAAARRIAFLARRYSSAGSAFRRASSPKPSALSARSRSRSSARSFQGRILRGERPNQFAQVGLGTAGVARARGTSR